MAKKTGFLKKEVPSVKEAKKVVSNVHKDSKAKETLQRTTIDLPTSIHSEVKIVAAGLRKSMKEYITALVLADLKKRGNI